MIKIVNIALMQGKEPAPIYTVKEGEEEVTALEMRMRRLKLSCCGSVEFDSSSLTDKDKNMIVNSKIPVLTVITPVITIDLYNVELLNEDLTIESLSTNRLLTFVCERSHIRSLQFLRMEES